MRKLLVSLLLVLSCAGLGAQPVVDKKNPPAPAYVAALFKEAAELAGYTSFCATRYYGCRVPAVVLTSFENENVRGQFDYHNPTAIQISVDHDEPGSLLWNETVIHEFVHYLQWLKGTYSVSRSDICEMHLEIETEAYGVGHAYLKKRGIVVNTQLYIDMLNMNFTQCKMAMQGG